MAVLCGPQSISEDDDMCWVARGSDPAYFSRAKSDLWHSASPPGFFHWYEGNSAIRGTFYHLHTLNIVAKRGDLVDKQKEDNKKSKIQIIKKYDSRYQGPPLIYTHSWSLQRCKKMAPLICVTTKLVLMMTDTGPKIVRKYTEIKAITVK